MLIEALDKMILFPVYLLFNSFITICWRCFAKCVSFFNKDVWYNKHNDKKRHFEQIINKKICKDWKWNF